MCAIFFVFSLNNSHGQISWQQLEGPYGGWINKVTKGFGDDIIAIATNAYISTDKCASWVLIENKTFWPVEYYFSEGKVYGISTSLSSKNCIYVSYDTMKTWSLKNTGLENQETRKLVFKDNDIYALTDSGAYISTNGGGNWTRCFYINSMVRNMIYNLKFNSKGMIFMATVAGLFRSKDNGVTWELMNPGEQKMKGNIENIILCQDEKIFLNTPDGMFRSYNDGDTWERIGSGIVDGNLGFIISPENGRLIIGKLWGGMLSSTDNGDTWKSISQATVRSLVITNDGKYLTTSENGVLMADSLTGTWTLSNKGINETSITAIFNDKTTGEHKNDIIAGSSSGMIYKSTDGGQTWKQPYQMEGSSVTGFVKGKGNMLFASSVWGGVVRSNDYGDTWIKAATGMNDPDIRTLAIDNNGNLYAGAFSVMYKSTNNGDSWAECFWQNESIQSSTIVISSTNDVYIGTLRFGLIKSTNGFASWEQINSLMYPVSYLAINKANELFAVTFEGDLYKSTNGGKNWTFLCDNSGITTMYFLDNNDIIAGVDQNHEVVGMHRSKDGGKTWTAIKEGIGNQIVYYLEANSDGTVYAGTSGGIYRSTQSIVSVSDGNEPANTADLSIFPNPAAGNTKLFLSIKESGYTNIEIFDLAGSRIQSVSCGYYEAGDYYIPFDTGSLAPGFYYLKCTVGGRSFARRLIVQ